MGTYRHTHAEERNPMSYEFVEATKPASWARIAVIGPPKSGKKHTALALASAWGGTVGVVDTEDGAAREYADLFPHLSTLVSTFDPADLPKVVAAANEARVDTLVISTISSYWSGHGGMLEKVAALNRATGGRDKNAGWDEMRPVERAAEEALRDFSGRVVVTCRTKIEWVTERDESTGQMVTRAVGTKPDQRDGFAYSWPVVLTMDAGTAVVRARYPALTGRVVHHPGAELADEIDQCLTSAEPFHPADERDWAFADGRTLEELRERRNSLKAEGRLNALLIDRDTPVTLDALFFRRRGELLNAEASPLAGAVLAAVA
jgi:AAA domain